MDDTTPEGRPRGMEGWSEGEVLCWATDRLLGLLKDDDDFHQDHLLPLANEAWRVSRRIREREDDDDEDDEQAANDKRARKTLREAVKIIEAENRPKYRSTDPETSKRAALEGLHRRPTQAARVLARFIRMGPATTDEVVRSLEGIPLNSGSTRVSELKSYGFLEPTGDTRPTEAGAQAEILRATVAIDGQERLNL